MNNKNLILNFAIAIIFVISVPAFLSFGSFNSKLGPELSAVLQYKNADETNLVWIYFKDKGPDSGNRLADPNSFLTQKSITRRLNKIKGENIFDERVKVPCDPSPICPV